MKIAERLEFRTKAPVLTFSPNEMVIEAARAMSEKNYGASIIVDSAGRPVGIITNVISCGDYWLKTWTPTRRRSVIL